MQLCSFFKTNLAEYTQEVIGQRSPCVSVLAAAKHLHAPKAPSFTENAEYTEAHHTVTCEVVHPAPLMQLTHDGINPWIACPAFLPCLHARSFRDDTGIPRVSRCIICMCQVLLARHSVICIGAVDRRRELRDGCLLQALRRFLLRSHTPLLHVHIYSCPLSRDSCCLNVCLTCLYS